MDWKDPLNESDLVLCLLLPEAQDLWKSNARGVGAPLQCSSELVEGSRVTFMSMAVDHTRLVERVVARRGHSKMADR